MRSLLRILGALLLLFALQTPARAMPPIEQARLANGLRVLLMQSHNVPMVVMSLSVPAGSWLDPAGRGGAASMLATMLGDHTAKHDYISWADKLDGAAIQLSGDASRDFLSLTLTTLKEALPEGINDFAEAALQPGWDGKRFAMLKSDAVAAAQKSLEEPEIRASQATLAALYPQHGYGHRPDGDAASLQRIDLKDLQNIYNNQFKPDGAVLAVSGDVTMDELLALIRPAFAGWKGKPAVSIGDIPKPAMVRGEQRHVAMQTRQMTVELSRLGLSRYDKAFFPDMLLNHIMGGGGFSSRLMTEVRVKRGLVYGVYSYFLPLAAPGPFVISLQTRSDQTDAALDVVKSVMHEMYTGHISKAELVAARDNLTGGFAHRLDSNAKRVGLMSMIGFYGLPLDYLQNWSKHINEVTLSEVKAEAARLLDASDWNLVEVGPEVAGKSH
jgi:zinc protease